MKLLSVIEFFRRHLRATINVCLGLLVLLTLVDWAFVDKHHAHTKIEHAPAFWSLFGFLACALIVYASKAFGHAGIMTREDYYDE
jgi:hypothetical protein